jgi:hypothetical protein
MERIRLRRVGRIDDIVILRRVVVVVVVREGSKLHRLRDFGAGTDFVLLGFEDVDFGCAATFVVRGAGVVFVRAGTRAVKRLLSQFRLFRREKVAINEDQKSNQENIFSEKRLSGNSPSNAEAKRILCGQESPRVFSHVSVP